MQENAKFRWNERNFRRHSVFFSPKIQASWFNLSVRLPSFWEDDMFESSWTQRVKFGFAENVFAPIWSSLWPSSFLYQNIKRKPHSLFLRRQNPSEDFYQLGITESVTALSTNTGVDFINLWPLKHFNVFNRLLTPQNIGFSGKSNLCSSRNTFIFHRNLLALDRILKRR